ncbi:phage tail protein [Methylomonas sp. MED-D]|uniref:phage tail protein n=1 Tax=unclassified Methylomonas TaxID=2608980 RepID=UPI00143A5308|nr:phage tail protein [Methylococcaceae bacterium WWC4]
MKKITGILSVILGVIASSANAAGSAVAEDPNANSGPATYFEFSAGAITTYFTDCKGMGSQNEVVESKVVSGRGEMGAVKVPGRMSVRNLTCSKALGKSLELWNWRQQVADGNIGRARYDATLIAYDASMTPIAEWSFSRAWPVSVDYNETTPGKETLIFAAERVQRVK